MRNPLARSGLLWFLVPLLVPLVAVGCTRANPEAVVVGRDLATLTGDGDLALIGDRDLALTGGRDLAAPPVDLASAAAVVCGATSCLGANAACCIATTGDSCTTRTAANCNNGGRVYECDGPEDCNGGQLCCTGGGGTGSRCTNTTSIPAACNANSAPFCHGTGPEDCPANAGWVACCPAPATIPPTPYRRCSKNSC
jgi:hypothetical protein